jgi:hypothetical protein
MYDSFLPRLKCEMHILVSRNTYKMADVVYSVNDRNRVITLKLECITSHIKNKLTQSEQNEAGVSRNEDSVTSALELNLDIDELHELHALSMRTPIRNYLSQLILQLEKMRTNLPRYNTNNPKETRNGRTS